MKKLLLLLLPLLFLFSCSKESVDYGNSYLRLTYYDVEPYYIDTYDSPLSQNFYWGEDYRVPVGNYSLYYEGEYLDNYGYVTYAWEIFYEIFRYRDHGHAPDVYFTIECNPEGPYMYEETFKSQQDEYTIEKEKDGYKIILNYKRVKPRKLK